MRRDISDFLMQDDDIISMKPSNSAGEHSSNTNTHFLLGVGAGGGHTGAALSVRHTWAIVPLFDKE